MQLNPEQQQAVEHLGSPLLVLAGAGSGKTRVITEKITWLIRKAGYQAHQIAAITFTNKAAKEMQERARKLLDKEEAQGLMVSTFHTLGLKIIRSEAKTLGYKPGFTIFDAHDVNVILKELAHKEVNQDIEEEDKDSRWIISRWKNDFVSPQKAFEIAQNSREQTAAKLYERYQRQLKAYNAVDFDDLIMLPVQLFKTHPEILEKWQAKLRYLLVDEYQDTNTCQYQLIKMLAGIRGEFTAVGDDDQSIYSWRGAKPENIHLLHQDYPNLKIVKLEQNYRSTQRILKTANHLIANNPHLIEKNLWSALDSGELIRIIPCRTVEHECEKVVSEIMKLHFREQAKWKDFAILYRSNHQSRLIERYLRENRIDYKVTGGTSFFDRSEVKDILAYLRLITNPADDAAFLRIINTPKRGIGLTTLEKLGEYAHSRNVGLLAASQEFGYLNTLTAKAKQRIEYFTAWIQELTRAAEDNKPQQIVQRIITDIAYEDWLKNTCITPRQAEIRMENVQEIVSWVRRLYDEGDGKEHLSEIIAHMSLMDLLEKNSEEMEGFFRKN